MKRCSKCGEEKELGDFYVDKGRPRANCKECQKAAQRARRKADPERVRAQDRAYNERNREARVTYLRRWWDENRDRANAQRRAARAADPERWRKVQRDHYHSTDGAERANAYYWANRDKILAWLQAWREENHEILLEYNRAWRAANRVEVNAYARAYYADNREKWEPSRRRRSAREAEVEWQPYTRREIFDRDGGTCRECEKELFLEPNGFHLDHIVPISLGGPDIPANLQLMCPTCNREKWARLEGQIHLPV